MFLLLYLWSLMFRTIMFMTLFLSEVQSLMLGVGGGGNILKTSYVLFLLLYLWSLMFRTIMFMTLFLSEVQSLMLGVGGGGNILKTSYVLFLLLYLWSLMFQIIMFMTLFLLEVQSLISWPGVRSCCPTLTSRCARSTWSWRRAQVRSSTVCFPWRFGSFTFTVIRKK